MIHFVAENRMKMDVKNEYCIFIRAVLHCTAKASSLGVTVSLHISGLVCIAQSVFFWWKDIASLHEDSCTNENPTVYIESALSTTIGPTLSLPNADKLKTELFSSFAFVDPSSPGPLPARPGFELEFERLPHYSHSPWLLTVPP